MRLVCGGNLPTRRTPVPTFGPPKVRQHCCPNLDAKILPGIQGAAQQISSLQLIFVFAGACHIGFAAALAKPTKNQETGTWNLQATTPPEWRLPFSTL
jgi:hypothetical protein